MNSARGAFILENAVELVNPPDRLLYRILAVFPGRPFGALKTQMWSSCKAHLSAGMAHAILSFVQRSRWAAATFFKMNDEGCYAPGGAVSKWLRPSSSFIVHRSSYIVFEISPPPPLPRPGTVSRRRRLPARGPGLQGRDRRQGGAFLPASAARALRSSRR